MLSHEQTEVMTSKLMEQRNGMIVWNVYFVPHERNVLLKIVEEYYGTNAYINDAHYNTNIELILLIIINLCLIVSL